VLQKEKNAYPEPTQAHEADECFNNVERKVQEENSKTPVSQGEC
jgi:hypothetical protein